MKPSNNSIYPTRIRGITRSVSIRCWKGDGFDDRPKPRNKKDVHILCKLSCFIHRFNIKEREL